MIARRKEHIPENHPRGSSHVEPYVYGGREKHNLASSFVGRFEVGVGEGGSTIELAVCGEGEGGRRPRGTLN